MTPESTSVKIMRFFFTGPEAAWRDAIFFHKRFVKNRIITKAALFGNFFHMNHIVAQMRELEHYNSEVAKKCPWVPSNTKTER